MQEAGHVVAGEEVVRAVGDLRRIQGEHVADAVDERGGVHLLSRKIVDDQVAEEVVHRRVEPRPLQPGRRVAPDFGQQVAIGPDLFRRAA